MPEIGGFRLAGSISDALADVRKMLEDVNSEVVDAVTELKTEVEKGRHVARAVRSEAKAVRDAMGRILGNATGGENQEADDSGGTTP